MAQAPKVTAAELMRKATPVLSFSATVPEAVQFFRSQATEFAIVQASADRFQGVLTEASLIRVYLRFLSNPEKDTLILYRDLFEPAQLIQAEEPFPEIVKKLVTAVSHRVFVIDEQGAVQGHITVKDVLPYFGEAEMNKSPEKSLTSDLFLYENFFSQSPFMMHSVNPDGVIQMANPILHNILGYDYPDLIGKPVFALYPKDVADKVRESLSQILEKGQNKVVNGQMVHKTGRQIEIQMISRALHNQGGELIGTSTVSHPLDMAELLRALPE